MPNDNTKYRCLLILAVGPIHRKLTSELNKPARDKNTRQGDESYYAKETKLTDGATKTKKSSMARIDAHPRGQIHSNTQLYPVCEE